MKFIGQYIQNLIARFRNDVYLEDISTGTIADGGNLGLDSNNKIVKANEASGVSLANGSDNRIVTATGTSGLNGEANFTYDGTDVACTADNFEITSANTTDPNFQLTNTTNDSTGPRFRFLNNRSADGQDGDEAGRIEFFSYDDGSPAGERYAQIISSIHDATSGEESGKLQLQVASHDGGDEDGLVLTGGSTDAEVDVTVGKGSASVTTIAGTLTMGSTAAMTNAGLLSVANQSNITGLGTITSGVWNGTAIATAYIADDAVTFAKASGVSPKVFGSTIKILPSDFMTNDDGGSTKFGIGFKEDDSASFGMKIPSANTELLAFVSIPEGMKATHVDIFDNSHNNAIEVFEANVNSRTITSKGSGNCNTTLDITDVNATATNYLMILITTTATSDRTYGGTITIAAQ